jgi:hypothetical protein
LQKVDWQLSLLNWLISLVELNNPSILESLSTASHNALPTQVFRYGWKLVFEYDLLIDKMSMRVNISWAFVLFIKGSPVIGHCYVQWQWVISNLVLAPVFTAQNVH